MPVTPDAVRRAPTGRIALTLTVAATMALVASCGGSGGTTFGPAETSSTTSTTTTTVATSPTAPAGGPPTFPVDWRPGTVEWEPCDGLAGAGMECATLAVPLDWSDPQGRLIDLALARVPATGERIGSLLSNPGGPGASGIELLAADPFGAEVAERFDLVSWDPRGVGDSVAVGCGDEVGDFLHQDPSPDDTAEQQAIEDDAAAVAAECGAEDGELLANLTTVDSTFDMEAIRLALGSGGGGDRATGDAEPLNYVGFSYGTQLGQQYLAFFGDRVRSMVLDGVVDPDLGFEGLLAQQTEAFDAAFGRAAAACADAGEADCGVADLGAAYDEVARAVETERLPGGPDGIGPAELSTAAVFSGYLEDGWVLLGPALADALDGDGAALWDLASSYYDFGSYGAYAGVVCTDDAHPDDAEAYRAFTERLTEISARFGPGVANEMLPCATWPVPPDTEAVGPAAPGTPPVLVVGNTGDPATPLRNAEVVASRLPGAALLVVDMEGHVAYGSNACAEEIIDTYLVDLVLPAAGTTC